ncbi:MAG TPA: aminoglycoside phosphotransferase family protein [Candidatus Omnitrophota bacterium]|nr:aminoglycoside phosphotransferase family protein [Candidatus Omnitrophota bacterium]
MILGVDFDNTIVSYDRVLYSTALGNGYIPKKMGQNKKAIRDAVRQLPDGEAKWQKLQAYIYGRGMEQAQLMDGVAEFFGQCQRQGIKLAIISHKTRFASMDKDGIDLQKTALAWMKENRFFEKNGLGLDPSQVYFESTRQEKIERIRALGCSYFVDDLEETFMEPSFPKSVRKVLFSPLDKGMNLADVKVLGSWREINEYIFIRLRPELVGASADVRQGAKPEMFSRRITLRSSNVETLERSRVEQNATTGFVHRAPLLERHRDTKQVKELAQALLTDDIQEVSEIKGGANSQVFFLKGAKEKYIAKFYFRHPQDQRDRLNTEYKGLNFLRKNGIGCVPQPLSKNEKEGFALYEYIEGEAFHPETIAAKDIKFAVGFLKRLKDLTAADESRHFAPASEAFFSAKDIIANIRMRLGRLYDADEKEKIYKDCQQFLKNEFGPLLDGIAKRLEGKLENVLLDKERTLSPSDFGFHNALRTPDKGIIFLDFEYFGWDDPAKTIADFQLHPAMELKDDLKRAFRDEFAKAFQFDKKQQERADALYPLFALKWCLIFLNEFVVGEWQRRHFSNAYELNKLDVLAMQLQKAKNMLNKVKVA